MALIFEDMFIRKCSAYFQLWLNPEKVCIQAESFFMFEYFIETRGLNFTARPDKLQ